MKFNTRLQTDESKFVPIRKLTVIVLEEAGRPMSIKEITEKILEKRFIASKTPNSTVCAALNSNEKIKRIDKNTYALT